ncbi:unnamed protein product [Choristocarpus tenellus]
MHSLVVASLKFKSILPYPSMGSDVLSAMAMLWRCGHVVKLYMYVESFVTLLETPESKHHVSKAFKLTLPLSATAANIVLNFLSPFLASSSVPANSPVDFNGVTLH